MTHSLWLARRFRVALAAPLLMVGVFTGTGPAGASASAGEDWTQHAAAEPRDR